MHRCHLQPHRRTARIVAERFEEGRDYAIRRDLGTDDWLLLCTDGGRGIAASGRTQADCRPRSLTLYRPRTPQHYHTHPDARRWRFRWAHCDLPPQLGTLVGWPELAPGLHHLLVDDQAHFRAIDHAMRLVVLHANRRAPRDDALALNALERVLLLADAVDGSAQHAMDPRVRAALAYINTCSDRPLDLAELARASGCSASRLSHLFREQVGIPPMRHHEQHRLWRAATLLDHTPHPVHRIAEQLGFADPYHFSRRFRAVVGRSPRAWRNRH